MVELHFKKLVSSHFSCILKFYRYTNTKKERKSNLPVNLRSFFQCITNLK